MDKNQINQHVKNLKELLGKNGNINNCPSIYGRYIRCGVCREFVGIHKDHPTCPCVFLYLGYWVYFGLGAVIAIALSWSINKSILWAVLHGLFGWLYVIYYAITQ